MAGFGSDSISVVTSGLKRATGSFSERLVSSGYMGNITETAISTLWSLCMALAMML